MKHIKIMLAMLVLIGQAHAQTIERLEFEPLTNQSEIKGSILVTGSASKDPTCGVLLNFGDGTAPELIEAAINQPTEFKHVYAKTGTFQFKAEGRGIVRFFSSVQPCAQQAYRLINVVDPAQFEDGSLDILVMGRTKSARGSAPPDFASNIDGTLRLVNLKSVLCLNTSLLKSKVPNQGFDQRVIREIQESQQLGLLAANDLYKQAGLLDVQKAVENHFERMLKNMKHTGNSNDSCTRIHEASVQNSLGMLTSSQVIAVPKYLLPSLQKVQSFSGIQYYTPLYTLTAEEAKRISQANQETEFESAQLERAVTEEFRLLAQSGSKEKVGSLIISATRSGKEPPAVCTLNYKDEDATAVAGYRGQHMNMLLPHMKERYAKQGISFARGMNKVFDNINDAFVEISRQPDVCHVFVDYPKNLSELESGFKRARSLTTSLGVLMDANAARELFSTQRGYVDYNSYKFAKSISGGAEDAKKLRAAGIINKVGFDELVLEIQQAQYSKAADLSVIYSYLADRDNAKIKKINVLAERDARLAEDKKRRDKEELDRQARREAYAKEFPYEAVISCDFQGRHSNLIACFAGGRNDVSTELEIRNGTNYAMYKSFDLYRLGREQPNEGLIVPLSPNFEIKAQNSSDTQTLTIKIRETATGKNMYTKSAAQYGVIFVNR